MSTPERKGKKLLNSSTPKLGRGIEPVESSFDSSALHQSGSKAVQNRVVGLNEQIVKRKTELAELLRSTGKKRIKKNEPDDEANLPSLQQGFPKMEAGDEEQDFEDGRKAMFEGLKGSLLSDSISYTQSPMLEGDHSEMFSPKGDANTYFVTHTEIHVTHELHMVQEQLEEVFLEGGQDQQEEIDVDAEQSEGQYAPGADAEGEGEEELEEGAGVDQSRISAFDTVLEYVGDAPLSDQSPRWPADNSDNADLSSSLDGFEANRVAKTLVFPDMLAPTGVPKSATFTPLVSRAAPLFAPASATFSIQTAFNQQQQQQAGGEGEPPIARRTSPLASHNSSGNNHNNGGSAEHKEKERSVGGGADGKVNVAGSAVEKGVVKTEFAPSVPADASNQTPYSNQHLVSFRLAPPSTGNNDMHNSSFASTFSAGSAGSYSSSYSALSYRDSLLHQLKVTTAKNEMLQGKLRDIEELVDRNYGSISERSKLLTAERNKLERQRTLLDDELVATKEELLFIRAQLQNKSARIAELESELLEAQRMLVEPGEGSEDGAGSDVEAYAEGDHQFPVSPKEQARNKKIKDASILSPDASTSSMHLGRSPAEVAAAEEEKTRDIELLSDLLAEQEEKLAEAEANKARLAELEQQYRTTLEENFQLAAYLETAEQRNAELVDRVSELDGQVRAAEELAFEFEAKAAELEVDLFRRMDEEHEALMKEARAAEYAAPVQHSPLKVVSSPGQEQSTPPPTGGPVTIATSPKQAERGGDVNTLTASHHDFSSPSLPLLSHPSAPPRIPREGYAVLLIVIAVLQAVVWGLVLLAGVMYVGMLELRFRVDILHDGGVFDQLFLLKGVSTITSSAVQSFDLPNLSWEYVAVNAQQLWAGLSSAAQEVVKEGMQLVR
eukprot:gene7662-9167_t